MEEETLRRESDVGPETTPLQTQRHRGLPSAGGTPDRHRQPEGTGVEVRSGVVYAVAVSVSDSEG